MDVSKLRTGLNPSWLLPLLLCSWSFAVFLQGETNVAAAPLWETHKPHRSQCHVEKIRRFVFFANGADAQNVGWQHVCIANAAYGEHCAEVLLIAASSVNHVAPYSDGGVLY